MAGIDRHRGWGIAVLAAGLLAAASILAVTAPDAGGAKKKGSAAPSLYVLNAGAGELDRTSGGGKREFELVLSDPDDVTVFTDRPARRAGQQKLRSFVRQWNGLGFRQDPPNAALVIADAPDANDVLVVELSNPQLRAGGETVAFRAEVLKGSATGALSKFRKRADPRVADEFGRVSLFVDPSGVAVGLIFTVLNAPPNDVILVALSNGTFAHNNTVPTSSSVTGPALTNFTATTLFFGPSGTAPVNGTLQSGANLLSGAQSVRGTVENLPTGASISLKLADADQPVPLTLGPFSVPIN
jgi:hypothetical protein